MFTKSSGVIGGNVFATCPGTPLFFEQVPGASADWSFVNNMIDGVNGTTVRALQPAIVSSSADASSIIVKASCPDSGAVARYTVDGSKPMPDSQSWPGMLTLAPRAVAVNIKCFPPATPGAAGVVVVESPVSGGIFFAQ